MSENPLKSDEKLQQLLTDVSSIQSGEGLSNWKASFLKVYKSYLDPDGVLNAREADGRLVTTLQRLAKASLKVQALTETGDISTAQVTADGRRALGNWTEEMTVAENAVARFCPKTSEEMDTVGYDKLELGAILIQDGFQAYEIMLTNRDFIQQLCNGPLQGILDKNQLSIVDYYSREMQSFVDIMSDLGLMKFMTKCVTVYKDEPRPDRTNEPDILLEPDTEEVVVDVNHGKGPDTAGSTSRGSKTKIGGKAGREKKTAKPGKKAKGEENDDVAPPPKEDEEEDEPPPQEGDGGEGEKVIYFDPKTGNLGLLPREQCMASELMFSPDGNGGAENNGVIESPAEKDNLVWLLKKLEKKKPKDGEWLEKIKKEKAQKAKEGKLETPSVRVIKDPVSGSPTKPKVKRPVKRLSNTKEAGAKPSGFKNPLEESSGPKKTKSRVQDYQGMYQKVAPKPEADGWSKVAPEEPKKD
jgi:hypothetical protein